MEKMFKKWKKKLEKGDEKYEGIFYQNSIVFHQTNRESTSAASLGVKLFKKEQLVWQEEYTGETPNNEVFVSIILKNLETMLVHVDGVCECCYFGNDETYDAENCEIDEVMLYFNGSMSGFLLHGYVKQKVLYLVNIGGGNETTLVQKMWLDYGNCKEESDGKRLSAM